MCKKLEIPLTTIQRRRKRLEKEFLEIIPYFWKNLGGDVLISLFQPLMVKLMRWQMIFFL